MLRVPLLLFYVSLLLASDWAQFRHDSGHTASTDEVLPEKLTLLWSRALPAPQQVWPKYPRMNFSVSYEPVVAGKLLYLPSMLDGSISQWIPRPE